MNFGRVVAVASLLATLLGLSACVVAECLAEIRCLELARWAVRQPPLEIALLLVSAGACWCLSTIVHEGGHAVAALLLRDRCQVVLGAQRVRMVQEPRPNDGANRLYRAGRSLVFLAGVVFQMAFVALVLGLSVCAGRPRLVAAGMLQLAMALLFSIFHLKRGNDFWQIFNTCFCGKATSGGMLGARHEES